MAFKLTCYLKGNIGGFQTLVFGQKISGAARKEGRELIRKFSGSIWARS